MKRLVSTVLLAASLLAGSAIVPVAPYAGTAFAGCTRC
jgi:hypothetical protein